MDALQEPHAYPSATKLNNGVSEFIALEGVGDLCPYDLLTDGPGHVREGGVFDLGREIPSVRLSPLFTLRSIQGRRSAGGQLDVAVVRDLKIVSDTGQVAGPAGRQVGGSLMQ